MVRLLIAIVLLFEAAWSWNSLQIPEPKVPHKMCTEGHKVMNECVECVCDHKHTYNCASIDACPKISLKSAQGKVCEPGMIYVHTTMSCVCNENGQWPSKLCPTIFHILPSEIDHCIPNSYVKKDCNVCLCNAEGKIDLERCTKNDCSPKVLRRSPNTVSSIGSKCAPGTWYSLAPCQFCYCVNVNKIVCSTGSYIPKSNLELGPYNLTVCGRGMLQEIMDLVPETQKLLRSFGVLPNPATMRPTTEEDLSGFSYPHYTTEAPYSSFSYPHYTTEETYSSFNYPYHNQPLLSTATEPAYDTEKLATRVEDFRFLRPTDSPKKYNEPVGRQGINQQEADGPGEDEQGAGELEKYQKQGNNQQESETSEEAIETTTRAANKRTPENMFQIQETKWRPNLSTPAQQLPLQDIPPKAIESFKQHMGLTENISFDNKVDVKSKIVNALSGNSNAEVYKINFPSVINKLLQMSLRRSENLELETKSNCTPGQMTKEGCNSCFCLNNGKLLCTHKPCVK